MKNYLFKITTDKNKGIGHFYRSFEISLRLKKKYNRSNVYFLNETNSQPEINFFSKKVIFLDYKGIDDILLIVKNMKISHLIFDQVSDCFNESQIIRKKFSDLKIFAFDYFKFNNKNINKFINIYSKKHHQSLVFNKNLKFSYGFDNVIIRKNFYNYINENKINNKKKLNIVITFGGSDPMNYTEKVLSHINYMKIPDVIFKILVPLNKKHMLFDFKDKYNLAPFTNIYFDPKNLVSIFKNADLVICGGGATLYEFCFLGKPILAIGQNIKEKEVIEFLSKNNYVYKITYKELNSKKMFQKMILNFVKNKIFLSNLSKKASNLINKKNYYKIVNDLI